MSDRRGESYHEGDGRSGQSVDSYHSAWMSHWTQRSCEAAPRVRDRLSLCLERKDDHDCDEHHLLSELGMMSDVSPSAKVYTEVTEVRTARIIKEAPTISKSISNRGLEFQSFPMFNLSQDVSSGLEPKNSLEVSRRRHVSRPQIDCNVVYNVHTTVDHFPSVLAVAPAAAETSSKECQPEVVSWSPVNPVNSPSILMGEGSSLAHGPSRGNFTGSTQMAPGRFNKGKAPVLSSFMSRQGEINKLTSLLGDDQDNYRPHSSLLVGEKKLDNHSKSGDSFLRQRKSPLLVEDAFAGSHHLPMLVGERCHKVQNYCGTQFFPSHGSSPEAANPETSYHEHRRVLDSVYDAETMRISTKNSVEGLAVGPGVFSQTAHSLPFLKKADVNLSKENLVSKESGVSTKLKRKMFSELLRLSPPMGENGQKSNLQSLSSSTESKGKDNVEGFETSDVRLKNESSAETDTLDMDTLKEHSYLPGVNSSSSKKDILIGQNQPTAGEEVRCICSVTRLPDINVEIPSLPAAINSMDNPEPSTSRTQSFDAEHLLSHADNPSKTVSSSNPDSSVRLEPSSRWLKRFKLSASDSLALGTKSPDLGEAYSHEKVNKLLGKFSTGSKSGCSEPTYNKSPRKEELVVDQTSIVLSKGESSRESEKKCPDVLLSHPWIQRWCHNRAAATNQKKPNAVVVCEPQSTKVEFDEMRNKQFPSIAAMALMGKAMTGFRSCAFRNRGSFTVWNTN